MNEIESVLFDWKAKDFFGFAKNYKAIQQAENKTIYQLCLSSATSDQIEVSDIKLSKYFIPDNNIDDLKTLINFLHSIENEIIQDFLELNKY